MTELGFPTALLKSNIETIFLKKKGWLISNRRLDTSSNNLKKNFI